MKLTNFHVVISSLAAIAGVALAAYQTFQPNHAAQQPVTVTVSLDPQKQGAMAEDEVISKSDAPDLQTETVDLASGANFAAALKDSSADRYSFSSLFDGASDTFLAIAAPDTELNVQVNFPGHQAREVTAIEYLPPEGVDTASMASTVDVTVLPEGQFGAGLPVYSFRLPQSQEATTFAIPGRVEGTGVILRIAGKPGVTKSYVGDFRILSERVAP
ncbi:hypothetical protein [Aestuariivirga sp.]|uniref:hypothetical protein n=1 Tax=Aestuariivirga sp. TaxID=2650926 RepID=UPI003BAD130F